MDTDSENDEFTQTGRVELKESIDLNSVLNGQTFEINFDSIQQDYEESHYPKEDEIEEFANLSLGFDSDEEDDDINSTPFEKLALKMHNITEDGKIKRRVKREGTGSTPPENSVVAILYTSYLEYNDEPTDYVHAKKPYQFRLGNAGIIGLNYAVASMKVNEKSQFLIHPDYAFGSMGHPPRIPGNATFFLQIELLRFVDSGPALQFDKLTKEEKKRFPSAYKTALGLMESGKEHFKHNNKLAIRDYNRALSLIEECHLTDMSEQEEQQKLRLKLLINLTVCYNKDAAPKKACTMCNTIFDMVKNTSLFIPAKVYFQNGRALFMLGEYRRAYEKLLRARKMEPHNVEITKEISKVSVQIEKEKKREKSFAKIFVNNNETEEKDVEQSIDMDDTFQKEIADLCSDLRKSDDKTQYKLPSGLTSKERQTAKLEAEKFGLTFRESNHNENDGKLTFYITKM